MDAEQLKAKHKLETHKYRVWFFRRAALVLAGLSVVLVGLYFWLDHPYKERFNVANTEVERIRTEVLNPAGAVELSVNDYVPNLRGGEFFRFTGCPFDVRCPGIDRMWFVPVEVGKEQAFVEEILRKSGYKAIDAPYTCHFERERSCVDVGNKANFSMGLTIRPLTSEHSPGKNVEPKVWRVLHFGLDYDWQK